MSMEYGDFDFEAIVAEERARAVSTRTLEQIVRDNERNFEGFARVRALQRTAIKAIAKHEKCEPASLRRTFLKVYGNWEDFSNRVRNGIPNGSAATMNVDALKEDQSPLRGRVWG